MRLLTKYHIFHVTWLDHTSKSSWHSLEDVKKYSKDLYEVETIGFLTYQDKKTVVLTQTIHGTDFGGSHQILRSCITSMTNLTDKYKIRRKQ